MMSDTTGESNDPVDVIQLYVDALALFGNAVRDLAELISQSVGPVLADAE